MFQIRLASLFLLSAAPLLIWPARQAAAQSDTYYQNQVYRALSSGSLMKDAQAHNYRTLPNGYWHGYIETGDGKYQTATFHLETGYIYRFVGACDSDCRDMDFALIGNQSEGILAEDTDPDDTPGIQFQPRRTGEYTLVAKIPRCNGVFGCYWAVQALGK